MVEAGDSRFVVKQALPQLRVEEEWLCDRRRILGESAALRTLAPLLPSGSVPSVLFEDAANCAYAMSAAAGSAETWKARLLRGECEERLAHQAGVILASLIRRTHDAPDIAAAFANVAIFDDLRLDPYYRFTARRHPDLADFFDSLISDCLNRREALVHGDFSPKNFLVDGDSILVIDWECVHYGNPAFDAAFLLNHLLLKSLHLPSRAAAFAGLALRFWQALSEATADTAWLERSTVRHLAGLLLARMDGKSPVEYIRDPGLKDTIRLFVRGLISDPPRSVAEVVERRLTRLH
jgi:aminoglycoside phosphotransferase (APT) family kinase protein